MNHPEARTALYPARKLFVALELASTSWKAAMGDTIARRPRVVTLAPFDKEALLESLEGAFQRLDLPEDCAVLVCMEAGRDGFSVHRWLQTLGIDSLVIDPASVDVNRQGRRAKTDRLDALKLLSNLIRHGSGEPKVWRVCRVPSEEAEDERHLHREREALVVEQTRHTNRIKSLLATVGIRMKVGSRFLQELQEARDPRSAPVPPRLRTRIQREHARLQLVREQLKEIDQELQRKVTARPEQDAPAADRKTWQLGQLKGIGKVTARTLVGELFGPREFSNRREVGSAAGLTPTPYDTGQSSREQGISKAGNVRVRRIAIEAAWSWLRFQPDSSLSRWYRRKFLEGGRRQVRKGIVALARKLLIALWHFVEHGVLPEGSCFKNTSPLAQAA